MPFFERVENFFDRLADRFRSDNEEHRRIERDLETEPVVEDNVVDTTVPLRVISVDFQAQPNAANHHCEKYELVSIKEGTPIIRRGGAFSFIITFNREPNFKSADLVKVYFSFGQFPNVHKGTQAVLTAGKKNFDKNHEEWDMRLVLTDGPKVTFEVQVPTQAAVGVWSPAVHAGPKEGGEVNPPGRNITRLDTLIYILFNPWNKNDSTYLPEEKKRQEYVLNDIGKIWVGTYPARGRHWVFGQFDDAVLPACILLLERSGVKPESRGDPILVSRAISKMVNSNDDNGVVVGRWGKTAEDYADGTAPSIWTGSINIMEQYLRTNRPVRYGQCWVFAGVVNTVCRALGLPSRVVTNLDSAHDTDTSLTIDQYLDKQGESIETYRHGHPNPTGLQDSIWNFHVWNDVWMTRPDLPHGYGGWQAIDATPQETSDGMFQCGPASLEAIRRGQIELKYDVPFLLAEVNADVVKWQEDETAQDGFKKLFSNKSHVGKQLLTKKPGNVENDGYMEGDREECTQEYKPPEGTESERVVLHTAARRFRRARHAFRLPSEAIEDVEFSILDLERVPIGDDFSITVTAKNVSGKDRTVSLTLRAYSTYYTGAMAHQITMAEGKFSLKAAEEKTLSLPVPYSKYYDKLVEHAIVKMVALCTVDETSYAWVGDDCFEVLKPHVEIELLSEAVAGKPLLSRYSFTNPLPIALRECSLVVDGPGITRPKTIPISAVGPKEKMSYDLRLYPKKEGSFTLVATFNSSQLVNLSGSVTLTVAS